MIILLKDLAIILISLFTALLATLGVTAQPVIAPDVEPPAVITEETLQEKSELGGMTSTSTIEIEISQEPELVIEEEISEPEPPSSTEDPFKDLADAFSQLAEEVQNADPVTQPQTPLSLNELVRTSLVNIICTTETAGALSPISASGVVVDQRGIVLTNAHVAQYFLLKDYPTPGFVDCFIRTGSPAAPAYTAELLFLPPSWIQKNAHKIDDARPTGNGEHDYALVRITGEMSNTVPTRGNIPNLAIALNSPDEGTDVTIAGYPAGFLGGATIQTDLYAASANARVGELYTYATQSIDLFSIGGSIVAQQGSSGGPVARSDGALVGLIVTSSDAPDTASRDLRALTTEYIIRDFENEFGNSLANYLTFNLADQAAIFNTITAPILTKALTDVLSN